VILDYQFLLGLFYLVLGDAGQRSFVLRVWVDCRLHCVADWNLGWAVCVLSCVDHVVCAVLLVSDPQTSLLRHFASLTVVNILAEQPESQVHSSQLVLKIREPAWVLSYISVSYHLTRP
jgi:hypothetical protein